MDFASHTFFRIFSLIALFPLLSACGENGPDLPTKEFSEEYVLADFNLDEDYDYWDIRLEYSFESADPPYRFIYQYDPEVYENLDNVQLQTLESISSENGIIPITIFGNIYAVALLGYSPLVIDSVVDLVEFFDEIDTEAELWVRLRYATDYDTGTTIYAPYTGADIIPETFEEVPAGYRVVLRWYDGRGEQGKDLVIVRTNGSVTKLDQLERGVGPISN